MNATERLRPLFESANGIHLTVYIKNGQGGEVVAAKMDEIPGDSAVYAIVDGGSPSREKRAV